MRILAVLALVPLLAVGQELNSEPEGMADFANNDTRDLCLSTLVPALVASGFLDPDTEYDPSTMMINAHTGTAEGINCFMQLEGSMFHVFLRIVGERIEGLVLRYTLQSYNQFAL